MIICKQERPNGQQRAHGSCRHRSDRIPPHGPAMERCSAAATGGHPPHAVGSPPPHHRPHPEGHRPAQALCRRRAPRRHPRVLPRARPQPVLPLRRPARHRGARRRDAHRPAALYRGRRRARPCCAPSVAVADIVGSTYTLSPLVWAFFPLNGVLDADAAIESLPVLSAQVTELADGVFLAVSMNHSVGDGTSFWEFFNEWSGIHRGGDISITQNSGLLQKMAISTKKQAPPVHGRWFVETSPVPIRLPFSNLRHVLRRFELSPVREGFFTFSAASVRKLKARANEEMAGVATETISSLQALLAHVWRAVCRAQRLPPGQETFYVVIIGCRGRVRGIPPGYVGNAVVPGRASCAVGEILGNGLGWTAWQLNRAVASFDEAALREFLRLWVREPTFSFTGNLSAGGAGLETGSSPRFDVFGNDFGWGRPVGVRSGLGDKTDGKVTVFEGPERGGSMSLEVCVAPNALERLVADEEFMDAVSVPPPAV
uniref:Uncharacterized protein n=1 Tax=Avena sativa TaxID=4498 RepID=A0ACD5YCU5_AVESA